MHGYLPEYGHNNQVRYPGTQRIHLSVGCIFWRYPGAYSGIHPYPSTYLSMATTIRFGTRVLRVYTQYPTKTPSSSRVVSEILFFCIFCLNECFRSSNLLHFGSPCCEFLSQKLFRVVYMGSVFRCDFVFCCVGVFILLCSDLLWLRVVGLWLAGLCDSMRSDWLCCNLLCCDLTTCFLSSGGDLLCNPNALIEGGAPCRMATMHGGNS